MKKLLLSLVVVSGFAYANCDVPENAQKVVKMLQAHNKTAVQVTYTPDQTTCANTCKSNVLAIDKTINVIMKAEPSGTGVCKFSKPS
jgi:hypothetical protein